MHTNGPAAGAFRGFGVPQAALVQETLYDDLAIKAGIDNWRWAGVPFYLMIPADPTREHISLPEVITPGIVIDAFERAR